ncbi:MAG: hypothetical protein KGJ62_01920 [Armatimonadetes bacterium]|nr:hypothetical protein [Armatimonadota bacterium]MDE2206733.1 hypothetical protein [Armatimonadota bacterium]
MTFTLTNQTGPATITVSAASATSNSCAQALTTASCTGDGQATLTATWIDANGKAWSASGVVTSQSIACPNNSGADPPDGFGKLPDNCNITWASTSRYNAEIGTATDNWHASQWATFSYTTVTLGANILFQDTCDQNHPYFAVTNYLGVGQRTVTFNIYTTDPCASNTSCGAFNPPPASGTTSFRQPPVKSATAWAGSHERRATQRYRRADVGDLRQLVLLRYDYADPGRGQ